MEASFLEETCNLGYLQDVISLEILLLIIHFLRPIDKFRLRLTCRRFYMAVSDPAAWRYMAFDYHQTPHRKALDATLRFCSPGVKELEINTRRLIPRFPWVRFTKSISKCAPTLTHISLLGFRPSSHQVNTSFASLSSLSHFMLEFDFFHSIWFPAIRSLKSFEIRVANICQLFVSYGLKAWLENGFFPRQFQISGKRCDITLHQVISLIDKLVHRHPPPSDVRAQFYLMYCDGPPGIFNYRPFFELKIEDSYCSVPVTHCSEITTAPLQLVLSTPQSATKIGWDYDTQWHKVCMEVPFSSVASTLAHLSLKRYRGCSHNNLEEIAFHCPLLKTLCLDYCENALIDLNGLASISEQCLMLEGLSLIGIHGGGINRGLLWNVLSEFKKLLYLSVEFCVLPVVCLLPEKKIDTLLSMQVGTRNTSKCIGCRSVSNIYLDTLALIIPTNLRVLRMEFPISSSASIWNGLNDLLCAVPNLQEVYVEKRMSLDLPSNRMCYQNITKLSVNCSFSYITDDIVEALVYSGQLTHCYLEIDFISSDAMYKLIEAPKLVCCHVVCRRKSPPVSEIRKAARSRGIPDFYYAIINYSHPPINPELRLLWSVY